MENGMNKAFYKYAADKAVMLRGNSYPENSKKQFSDDDTQVIFSWSSSDAGVFKLSNRYYNLRGLDFLFLQMFRFDKDVIQIL